MATFRWKGRGPDGHAVQGELEARSKEDVIERLRAQRIMVSQIVELGAGEPPDPDRVTVRDPDARPVDARRPRPLRGFMVAALFLLGAAGVAWMALQRPSDGQWIPLLLAGILALIAVMMIVVSILALFSGPSKWVQDRSARLSADLDERRKANL